MNISEMMANHGIQRIVYVPASDLLPSHRFHAWRFDNHLDCGRGLTVEEAIMDAARLERLAA